jgi:ribosomal protein S18 acetylase RimI-like enzyme
VDFADAVHLIDIALIPEIRGKGLGTQLLNWLIGFARSGDRLLTLEVAFDNPAQRLYERLGFVVTRQGFPYSSMLCR